LIIQTTAKRDIEAKGKGIAAVEGGGGYPSGRHSFLEGHLWKKSKREESVALGGEVMTPKEGSVHRVRLRDESPRKKGAVVPKEGTQGEKTRGQFRWTSAVRKKGSAA